jgi:putative flippase GtrA
MAFFNVDLPVKAAIHKVIDLFYPLFRSVMDLQTYRFLACGGINVALDIVMYFISYNFIIQKQIIYLPLDVAISPHIAAFLLSFSVCFPLAFLLMRNVAFPDSTLAGRIQLIRYFIVVMINLILNYVLLKIFVEQFGIYPTPSRILAAGIVVVVSYVLQRNFTFKA